jgi:hypothetical protein
VRYIYSITLTDYNINGFASFLLISRLYNGCKFLPEKSEVGFRAFFQCCGSGMFIPDPNFFHPASRIRIKEFKHFNPKKLFLRSRKYDPGCWSRSRIWDSDPDFLPIPDPGFPGQKGTGSATLNFCEKTLRASFCRQVGVVGKFVEFFGPGVATLSIADRATIANMCPEYGK